MLILPKRTLDIFCFFLYKKQLNALNAFIIYARISMMDILKVRQHIEKKFSETDLKTLPFPYLVIENFFPDNIFENIISNNPFQYDKGKEWISRKGTLLTKNKTPYYLRNQINFYQSQEFESPEETKAFWTDIQKVFLDDDWFINLVYKKFPEYFHIRFGKFFTPENYKKFESQMFLQSHQKAYSIGPHTDISSRIFTCIFAYADRAGYEHFGTEILEPKDKNQACWGDFHHDVKNFNVVDVAPYKQNNFLLFFKTRQSFHSVPEITPDVPNGRYGMQFQFYEPEGGALTDLSRDDLYCAKHESALGKVVKAVRKFKAKLAS